MSALLALLAPVLFVLLCQFPQRVKCQGHISSSASEMTIDSVDMVTFRCPESPWRLAPGYQTMVFVEGLVGMREYYSNCMGRFSCTVKREFLQSLPGGRTTLEYNIGEVVYDEQWLMCCPVGYCHGINGTDRTPLFISNQHWQRGYIYTIGTEAMELSPTINVSNPYGRYIEVRAYYLYDAIHPNKYDMMTMRIEGPRSGCVILDHSEPRKWIITNMETVKISFSSCSNSGRFGIGYSYSDYSVPVDAQDDLVVMDGDQRLIGKHTCNQRNNRCPQASPTPRATSTPFSQQAGVGVVVGGSLAGGILLAVLVILILVLLLRKRNCLPLQKQPVSPQTIESVAPTAPGMDTLLRESQQGSIASSDPPKPRNTPDIVPGSSISVNRGNVYSVVEKERRQPPPKPPRRIKDNNRTIVENDLDLPFNSGPGRRGSKPSASVFIVENDGYDSVQWGVGH